MTALLAASEAQRLRTGLAERTGGVDGAVSDDAQTILPLLTDLDADAAKRALDGLPAKLRARLDALSPMTYVAEIRAPLIVLAHDRDDGVVPIDESRRLWSALAGRKGVHYTELGMFEHMDPTKRRVSPLVMIRELAKFYLLLYPVFRQSLQS